MLKNKRPQGSSQNRLLAKLPKTEYKRIQPHLERVQLGLKDVLYEAEQRIEHVYFPTNGVTSVVTLMADGSAVEVATIGNEGFVGLPVFLGAVATSGRAFCQVPGEAERMTAAQFREALEANDRLHDLLHRYTQTLFLQISQSAACNRLHCIEERCARWLLMTHDRVTSDDFPLTHDFLGQMLGVRRSGVTVAASRLRSAGLIRYSRGRITVLDRKGLEDASCECYRVIQAEYERLVH